MDQPGNHILLRGNQGGAADRMRDLLARTVQDHVADQRSNAGALEDIRQRMEGLEWLVKEVREREIPGLAARLDGLAGHLDQAAAKPPGWAESLAEHIELLRTQVTTLAEPQALPQLQAVCDTVGQALEALRAQDERMARLHHNVGKLQQSMEAAAGRFSRLDKAVAELAQRTAQLDKEMSAVKGRTEVGFSALTARLDQGAEKMTAATQELGGQVQVVHERIERLADTDDKLGSLDAKLTAADAKLTAADAKASSTDARVAALGSKLERLDERLDDQYDRVSVIDKGLVSVDGKLSAVDGKVGALSGRLDGLAGGLDGLDERLVAQIAGQLEPLTEEVRSRPGHAEVAEAVAKIVDAAQGEVTARIGSLEETVLTLAEALLRPQGPAREGTRI